MLLDPGWLSALANPLTAGEHMARITVEDCLSKVDNRFDLVLVASRRARQLATGGKEPLVQETSDKPTVIALREIATGKVGLEVLKKNPASPMPVATP